MYQPLLDQVAQRKVERQLAEARQREAEEEFLALVEADYQAGRLSFADLCGAHLSFRDVVGTGHSKRWDETVSVKGQTIRTRLQHAPKHKPKLQPHTGKTYWSGSWPRDVDADTTPEDGQNVVYVLFDDELTPCYIGSTGGFLKRMYKHVGDGKKFSFWMTYPCDSREAAFAREDELLAIHMPYLNQRATNGRGGTKPEESTDLLAPAVSRG